MAETSARPAREVNHEVGEVVPELSTFILPGRIKDPSVGLDEAIAAERAGFSKVWISERFDLKDIGVLTGAVGALTSQIGIASGLVVVGSRHPAVMASWAQTMQATFGPRLTVGLGRGARSVLDPQGIPFPTMRATEDLVRLLKALWAGETIDYDGPLGRFPALRLPDVADVPPPPVHLGAFGAPRAADLAGRLCDGIVLPPFLTTAAVAETARLVHEAAERAGRDPAQVRVTQELVAAPERDEEETVALVHARLLTYVGMSGYGEHLMRRNGWDEAALAPVHAHPVFSGGTAKDADARFHRAQLVDAARLLPEEWATPNAAVGPVAACVDRIEEYLAAGADEICLHGATPEQTAPLVAEYRRRRER